MGLDDGIGREVRLEEHGDADSRRRSLLREGGRLLPLPPGTVSPGCSWSPWYCRSAGYKVFTSTAVVPFPRVAEIRAGCIGEGEPLSTTYQ
jgi:hypothetical protein